MCKITKLSVLLLLLPCCVDAKTLFFSGFETGRVNESTTSTIDDTWYGAKTSCQRDWSYKVVKRGYKHPTSSNPDAAPAPRAGNYMLRFENRLGDNCVGGNYRNEIEQRTVMYHGKEYWVGFSWYFPTSWEGEGHNGYIHQIKCPQGSNYSESCPGSLIKPILQNRGRPWTFTIHQIGSGYAVRKSQWIDFVYHIKLHNSDGILEVWMDGKKLGRRTGDMSEGGDGVYRVGWRAGQYVQPAFDLVQFFDEFRIGESYADVVPGQGASRPTVENVPSIPANLEITKH